MGNTLSMSHPPFFVSEPNLTPSDKKLGSVGGKFYSVKSLRLFIKEYREFSEVKEFWELVKNKSLNSLNSLNSLITI